MGYKKRHIGAADVMIDETTGALLVKIGDAELSVDVADVDVQAIVDGIAGGTPKTLADLYTAIGLLATESGGNLDAIVTALGLLATEEGGNIDMIAEMSEYTADNTGNTDANTGSIREDTWEIRKNAVANTRQPRSHYAVVASAGTPVRLGDPTDPDHDYIHVRVQAVKPGAPASSSSGQGSGSSAPSSSSSSSSSISGEAGEGGPGTGTLPGANTGNIFIWNGEDRNAAFILTPGQTLELPPNCHLYEFWVDAANDGDGVVVLFSQDEEGERPEESSSSSSSSSSSGSSE